LTVDCAAACCCSEDRGPTRNLLTSQFLTPAELKQMLLHCHSRGDRQGLMLAAMLALGVYNGFRSVGLQHWPTYAGPCFLAPCS
jgi:integrase